MGDLTEDTAVSGADGHYMASLVDDWRIWGPMGGYVASVALRAAAREVAPDLQPASLTAQFLATARFEPVEIDVVVRRSSSRAALAAVRITQSGRDILDLQAWFTAPAEFIEHDCVPGHEFGHPDDHLDIRAHTDEAQSPFWDNFERRPVEWIGDWDQYQGGFPEWAQWQRFSSSLPVDDPVVDACRLLVLADLPSYPAAIKAHPRTHGTWIAPSLDLAVQFHRVVGLDDWLLVHGRAPLAHRGLLSFRSEVWTASGLLAASGAGQMVCRRVAADG